MDYVRNIIAYMLKDKASFLRVIGVADGTFFNKKKEQFMLFRFITLYHAKNKIIPTFQVIEDAIKALKKVKLKNMIGEELAYAFQLSDDVDLTVFEHSLKELIKEKKNEILTNSLIKASDHDIAGNFNKAEREIEFGIRKLRALQVHDSPQGNIRNETSMRKHKYKKNEKEKIKGIKTGFDLLDDVTGGGKPGRLWLWCAYTGEGKTRFCIESSYNVWMQGYNVVFVTLEMLKEDVQVLIESRHSHNFVEGGLPFKLIQEGTLNREQKKIYFKTLEDIEQRKELGVLEIWQASDITAPELESKLYEYSSKFEIHLCTLDYLELMRSKMTRADYRIQVTDLLKSVKGITNSFDGGKGLWVLSAHQASRGGRDAAEKRGFYVMNDLAESSGAERNSDVIGWNLQTEEMKDSNELKQGIMKNRFGQTISRGIDVAVDYAHARIYQQTLEDAD